MNFATIFFLSVAVVASLSVRLDHYNIDSDAISVSGMSSGAFFSVQFHVAFSHTIMGAGVVAGGPFWCAQYDISIALSACMSQPELISVPELVTVTRAAAICLTIDDPSNMKNHKVFLFSGTNDTEVVPGVVKKLEEYYSYFTNGIATQFSIPSAHAMVTDSYGNACSYFGSPYINNCGYLVSYHILNHIYGDIKMAKSNTGKSENLLQFDQAEFFIGPVSMDSTGFLYVPKDCQNKTKQCRLHIVFHGCRQGRKYISDTFALHSGYNGLAEENDIIMLYPQVTDSLFNPKGCWDWWGYTAPSYASKLGPQMSGVKKMLDRTTYG